MKTVPSNEIRKDFTDIANKVKYTKESYIVTNQNKPSVGIVPIEFLQLLPIIRDQAMHNKQLANALKDFITYINDADMEFLDNLLKAPTNVNPLLKNAAKSLDNKLLRESHKTSVEYSITENDVPYAIEAVRKKQLINPFTGSPVVVKPKATLIAKTSKVIKSKKKVIKNLVRKKKSDN